MLTAGDQVTVMFNNKTYHGVVDPTGDLAGPESDHSQADPALLTAHAPPVLSSRDDTLEQDPTQDGQPCQEKPPRAEHEP